MKLFLTSIFSITGDKLLELLPKPAAHCVVAFIPTASDIYESKPWVQTDRDKLMKLGFKIFDCNISNENKESLKQKLGHADIIFVAGGNTTFLLQECYKSGFAEMLQELLRAGKMYVGSSAGSIIVGPSVAPYQDEELKELPSNFPVQSLKGIGLIDYVVLPHYNQEKYAEDNRSVLEKYSPKFSFRTLNDNEALIVENGNTRLITV